MKRGTWEIDSELLNSVHGLAVSSLFIKISECAPCLWYYWVAALAVWFDSFSEWLIGKRGTHHYERTWRSLSSVSLAPGRSCFTRLVAGGQPSSSHIGLPGLICVMSALFNQFLLSHLDALIVIYLLVYCKVKTPHLLIRLSPILAPL